MTHRSPYACDRTGQMHVCGDGPELLVYNGDGSPRWKKFCDDLLMAVAATPLQVMSCDATGRVTTWRAMDGEITDTVELGCLPIAVAVSTDGLMAVCGEQQLFAAEKGGFLPIQVADPTAVGFGEDRHSLGVGTASGSFVLVSPVAGEVGPPLSIGAPITGVAWSKIGFWAVMAGNRMYLVSADGAAVVHTSEPADGPMLGATVSDEGGIVATIVGLNEILVYGLQTKRPAGKVRFRREVGGIGFGARGQLGVGLDDGDASQVDLFTGGSIRTEPHKGRGRNNWNLEVDIDFAGLRGAVTFARGGGGPVASFVYLPEDEKKGGWFRTCGMTCGVVFILSMFCTGCSGLAWIARMQGLF
jgi:hypothetical protein